MDTKEELVKLFGENLALGKFANCQSLITEIANSDVLLADKLSTELRAAQDSELEESHNDEQLKHREVPEMDTD